ncbi:uncharacterized protein LOC142178866 [Nicotiana tabacum]|uniref:Uncharacterized protein LOC142178866 n=1 Tax=Nicotiana tabacum TaxID=4097 RepID=A0AC58U5I9_TOBAC
MERYRAKICLAQAVTLRLTHTETHVELILTLVYAKCDRIERIELLDSLYAMTSDMTVPWLVGGDFNVIWDEEEKFGGLPVSLIEVDDFRHCINTCNLTDLGFKGSIFTWWNGRSEEDLKENWNVDFSANHFCIFNYKLKKLKKALSTWSRATYGDIFQKIAILEEVQAEMIKYLALEEEFWRQKEGMLWFKDGDRNTKFFHAQIEEDHLIAEEALKFYKDQFTESEVHNAFDILNHVPSMVESDQHERLMALTSNEEVKRAVMWLNGDSAGGPDGFTGSFYQK